jgi:hypothetical protein
MGDLVNPSYAAHVVDELERRVGLVPEPPD